MRATVLVLASVAALSFAAAANAAQVQTAPSGEAISEPITYSGNDGNLVCHHLLHQGEIMPVVQCHTQAGWDRLRQDTHQALFRIQMHALVQHNN